MYMIQIKWGTKSLRYLKESNNGGGGGGKWLATNENKIAEQKCLFLPTIKIFPRARRKN